MIPDLQTLVDRLKNHLVSKEQELISKQIKLKISRIDSIPIEGVHDTFDIQLIPT